MIEGRLVVAVSVDAWNRIGVNPPALVKVGPDHAVLVHEVTSNREAVAVPV
jgi:hypothetical protein